jgi:hypothetical protein
VAVRKEVLVKAQTGSQRHSDQGSEVRVGPHAAPQTRQNLDSTSAETQVLGCLQDAGVGLTLGQLEAKLSCSAGSLQETIDLLVEHRLIVRLNTIIPSYSCRRPAAGVHAE